MHLSVVCMAYIQTYNEQISNDDETEWKFNLHEQVDQRNIINLTVSLNCIFPVFFYFNFDLIFWPNTCIRIVIYIPNTSTTYTYIHEDWPFSSILRNISTSTYNMRFQRDLLLIPYLYIQQHNITQP